MNALHIEQGGRYIDYGGRTVLITGQTHDQYRHDFDVQFDDGSTSVLLPEQIICEKTGQLRNTVMNGKWALKLPEHRYARYLNAPDWEPERLDSMHKHLNPNDYIIDIGAEEGDFPALFASWGLRVGLIEPQPLVWPNIKAIWRANQLPPPVFMHEGFAGDQAAIDKSTAGAPLSYTGWPSSADGEVIGNHGFSNLSERPDLLVTTVDILTELFGSPDALTIDVEGADYEVIMGAQKTLELHKPQIWISIHPEFMFDMYGHYSAELFELITRHGYEYELLAFDHEWHVRFWHPDKHQR